MDGTPDRSVLLRGRSAHRSMADYFLISTHDQSVAAAIAVRVSLRSSVFDGHSELTFV